MIVLSEKNNIAERLFQTIGSTLERRLEKQVVVLDCGHFNTLDEDYSFAVATLNSVLELVQKLITEHGRSIKIILAILIDDLGLACGTHVCETSIRGKTDSTLPNELEKILAENRLVKRERVFVQTERNCRNRGLERLKKLLGSDNKLQNFQVNGDEVYFQASTSRIVRIAHREKLHYIADCPLVMAQHYTDLVLHCSHRFPQQIPTHIVDYSELADYAKVTAGAELAFELLSLENGQSNLESITNTFWTPASLRMIKFQEHRN